MINSDYIFFFLVLTFIFCENIYSRPSSLYRVVDTCECGTLNELAPRIVGGKETDPHQYPWMVAIFNYGKIHCGGSLINDRYIVTAGHCLMWSKKENLAVILGLHDRNLIDSEKNGGVRIEIEDIIVHEDFSSDYLHDTEDIGLIKLKNPVNFTAEIRPVCLSEEGNNYASKRAVVTGWGRTAQNGESSMTLRKANVTVLTNERCKSIASIGEHIMDSMLCAYENEIDACQGDSGGPLLAESPSGVMEQIGVVSWGIGCAKPGIPGVYTRISTYLEWLALHTIDANYCKHP